MGYIYIRTDNSNHIDGVCKLGQTISIPDRENTYITNEYVKGEFLMVIEISKIQKYGHVNHITVENMLHDYFKHYHMEKDGGTEFYKKEIINEIEGCLTQTFINFRVLTREEINMLNRITRIQKKTTFTIKDFMIENEKEQLINNDLELNNVLSDEEILRNRIQSEYIVDIVKELEVNKKVFIKAPTGFGKTHVYHKTIKHMMFDKILFLTPRKTLNIQITHNKYFVNDDNYKIIHYSETNSNSKDNLISNLNNNKIMMTSCYQSCKQLFELLKKYGFKFDIIIFDEAHYITTWIDSNEFLTNDDITIFKLFGSATPTEDIENKVEIFGNIIEKVKVHELINSGILCDIDTIVKQLDNAKSEYHNLKDLIVGAFEKYNKKKGIIYVNNSDNAINLYNLLKTQTKIHVYIYITNDNSIDDENNKDISNFEKNKEPSIIIAIGKISYGYDNEFIDFICLGDPRQSDTDIRQIVGRGLRWNKKLYPNKLLHLLIPLYKDEFNKCSTNETLKNYLNYIIGECDKDIIVKDNGKYGICNNNNKTTNTNDYEGDNVLSEILREYCTTMYNKFTQFQKFLKNNNVYDEETYNDFIKNHDWMPVLGEIQKRYPKFCFKHIHPNNTYYYSTKQMALDAYKNAEFELSIGPDKEKYKKINKQQKMKGVCDIDNKIPNMNFNLYYGV